jgi:glucose/mannose-6-phosphate isomerase
MKTLIENFPNQLLEAIQIAHQSKLSLNLNEIRNVVISGLGGSGIGGTLIAELSESNGQLPIIVNKKYQAPNFISKHTLFIASSYSGNTEETIEATLQAKEKEAKIVCISSGGKIIELAKQHSWDYIIVPGGNPPRACLGYSLVQLLHILTFYKIIPPTLFNQLSGAVQLLKSEADNIKKEALEVANRLQNKLPIIYTLSYEAVAIRFRQQINENAKSLCWHHIIPEMNHNELVGWRKQDPNLAVVVLRNSTDYYRNVKRLEVNLEIISKYTPHIIQIYSKGENTIEQVLYHIHLTDWVSYFMAEQKGTDVMEVQVIDYLKNELSKL